jgi:superfamily I DNA/RNA helicase
VDLDPDQLRAVAWRPKDGHLNVEASAGSGKTTLLSSLVPALLRDGIPADRIVATTFANRAAKTLLARIKPQVYLSDFPLLRVGTFHALGLKALRQLDAAKWDMTRNTDTAGRTRQGHIPATLTLWRAAVEFGKMPGTDKPSLRIKSGDAEEYLKTAQKLMAFGVRGPDDTGAHVDLESFPDAWELVQKSKAALEAWDFYDLLFGWADALEAGRSQTADVVIIDESQDTSRIQADIVKGLLGADGKLVTIGDFKQSINSFAGADPHAFDGYAFTHVPLSYNYRSGRKIIDLGNKIAARVRDGEPSKLTRPVDGVIRSGALDLPSVVQDALTTIQSGRSFAFLARTNAELAPVQAAFVEADVPFTVVGQNPLFEHREVETVLCYCLLAQHDAWGSLEKVINRPRRFLGKTFIEAIRKEREDAQLIGSPLTLLQAIEAAADRMPPGQKRGAISLHQDLCRLRATEWRRVPDAVAGILALRNVSAEVRKATTDPDEDSPALYAAALKMARKFSSSMEFLDFGDRCARLAVAVRGEEDAIPSDKAVLSSVHRVKGAQADVVYVLASEGRFPHPKCSPSEELRLFYVAVTRAKDRLHVVYDSERGASPYASFLKDDD